MFGIRISGAGLLVFYGRVWGWLAGPHSFGMGHGYIIYEEQEMCVLFPVL